MITSYPPRAAANLSRTFFLGKKLLDYKKLLDKVDELRS